MLTDMQCRNARGRDKPYKLSDALGLYLYVTPTGFRSWRFKYRFGKKEKRLVIGPYPEVSLTEARVARDDARRQLRAHVDPTVEKAKRAAAAMSSSVTTFRSIAEDWFAAQSKVWTPRYAKNVERRLAQNVYPAIGMLPIREVTAPMVLELVRKVERRGALEMAHHVRKHVSAVFVYAIASGLAIEDPAHVIRTALQPMVKGRQPAVRTLVDAQKMLSAVEAQSRVYPVTKLASRLLALTAARPGVVRLAEPHEFEDLDGMEPIWRIPAEKMKQTLERKRDAAFEFVVPLSAQAVELVKVALELVGKGPRLFPSVRSIHRPISDNTLSKCYRDAGFSGAHVPHGWRSTFSTIMNERAAKLGNAADRAIIDLMLAHTPEGVEAAYNRAAYMPRRRDLAQEWADMLMAGASHPRTLLR